MGAVRTSCHVSFGKNVCFDCLTAWYLPTDHPQNLPTRHTQLVLLLASR
jgi:hypothetical protein